MTPLPSLLLLLLLQVHTNPFQLVAFNNSLLEPGSRPFASNFYKVWANSVYTHCLFHIAAVAAGPLPATPFQMRVDALYWSSEQQQQQQQQ
jgi:hypothetical protein